MELKLPLDQMTTEEKLRAIEEIWESIACKPEEVPSTLAAIPNGIASA